MMIGFALVVFLGVLLEAGIYIGSDTFSIKEDAFAMVLPARVIIYAICLVLVTLFYRNIFFFLPLIFLLFLAMPVIDVRNSEYPPDYNWEGQGTVKFLGFFPVKEVEILTAPRTKDTVIETGLSSNNAMVRMWLYLFKRA